MIISRTPLRVSFVGGGSDIPSFYEKFGGAVLSTSISKYVYVTINPKFDHHTRISYSRTEEVEKVESIQHPLVREAMLLVQEKGGIELTSIADIPSKGSGLGSSSAFTVGLLKVLHAYSRKEIDAESLAQLACRVEIEKCREPIGKQDQYAAAYGGMNLFEFQSDGKVLRRDVTCKKETLQRLEKRLLLFYTGMCRSASAVLRDQQSNVSSSAEKQGVLKRMVQLAYELHTDLCNNNIQTFGEILNENWMLKRSLADQIASDAINHWYESGIKAGAKGGKLLGAGGGGFLMFYAPEDRHEEIERALPELRRVSVALEREGSKIIFDQT